LLLAGLACPGLASEFHVGKQGKDSNPGTKAAPVLTIQRAADMAQPGDTITVHEGTYRERVTPPRGGASDKMRITYQAAKGETVEIKGSEIVNNWEQATGKVWKVTLPNSFFGGFNPYKDEIRGDWFNPKDRKHHTGAVYFNGHWLVEAASLDEVLAPKPPTWLASADTGTLLNVAWLQAASPGAARVPANAYAEQQGTQKAPCTEGGECVGWIESGDWLRYKDFNFGENATRVEIRTASATEGGLIELRLDTPAGDLLGSCTVPHTGGWQVWQSVSAKVKPVSGVKDLCLVFRPIKKAFGRGLEADGLLWFASVDETNTTIWAQFPANPNAGGVEINVRRAVYYPDKPGRDFITIRGFRMSHAATQWAPPTAEQIGLVGTHWSKGWIIENNTVSYSICSGVSLGKYGDKWDNTSADTAEGYVKTIERALENGWNRDTIGHHVVRDNVITDCEQTGLVGSLGSAFCTVEGNVIRDIHMRRLFTGAEMAGIKFHAAIDTVIRNNDISRTCLGLWLDWMAQGARVSGNVFHENGLDLFIEVNHGPFVFDNNLFLSPANLHDVSEGAAFAHNLFAGRITSYPEPNRETPFHPAHTTKMAGLSRIKGGDSRFYNNIFISRSSTSETAKDFGLAVYNARENPLFTGGNIFCNGAQPYAKEVGHAISTANPKPSLAVHDGKTVLKFAPPPEMTNAATAQVETDMLGKALVPGLPYENADGSELEIDRDFHGKKRNEKRPSPGPFELDDTKPAGEWVISHH
jgi:hypothetical protein